MTLIIAAKGENHIVVGSDRRGTLQFEGGNIFIKDNEAKLTSLSKHVAVLVCGNGRLGTEFVRKFGINGIKDDITKTANAFKTFLRTEAREAMILNSTAKVAAYYWQLLPSFILTGLNKYKKPEIYRLEPQHSYYPTNEKKYAIDGKSYLATFLFEKQYKTDLTEKTLPNLVAQAIYETGKVDPDVSTEMDIAIINKAGVSNLTQQDIRERIKTKEDLEIDKIIRDT